MNPETRALLEDITGRNPGATDVFFKLIEAFDAMAIFDFAMLKQMDIRGSDLWDLYQYCCNRDIDKLHESIMTQTAIQQLQAVPGSKFYQKPAEQEVQPQTK